MTETAMCYGTVLWELDLPKDSISRTEGILQAVPQIVRILRSPVISFRDKERAIDRIFPAETGSFLKVVCRHGKGEFLEEIFQAYHRVYNEKKGILAARLTYVTEPDERQKAGILEFLKERYQAETVTLEMKQDKSLMGGFVIEAAGQETDCSLKRRLACLEEKLSRR